MNEINVSVPLIYFFKHVHLVFSHSIFLFYSFDTKSFACILICRKNMTCNTYVNPYRNSQ